MAKGGREDMGETPEIQKRAPAENTRRCRLKCPDWWETSAKKKISRSRYGNGEERSFSQKPKKKTKKNNKKDSKPSKHQSRPKDRRL